MKQIGIIVVKITSQVSLMTVLKWRLLGMHKQQHVSSLPEGYSAKNSRLFKIKVK